jgi:hypothetical protein
MLIIYMVFTPTAVSEVLLLSVWISSVVSSFATSSTKLSSLFDYKIIFDFLDKHLSPDLCLDSTSYFKFNVRTEQKKPILVD